jgi:hypothetical protein
LRVCDALASGHLDAWRCRRRSGAFAALLADIGFAWAAWIIDPATNALGVLQIKE